MTVQYTNRKRKTYYLHQGTTKTGKPKYFFSTKTDGDLLNESPPGYEIYENPNSQVFLRKIQPKLITDDEKQTVEQALKANLDVKHFIVEVKKKQIIIHTPDQDMEAITGRLEPALGLDSLFGNLKSMVKELAKDANSDMPDDVRQYLLEGEQADVRLELANNASYSPMMRFDLEDKEERTFVAMRYCFRGSIDDWIYIGGPDKLSALVQEFVPHLEKESFYELY